MNPKMSVKIIPEGVIYNNEEESRLTVLLLVPFYSFFEKYETRRAGCPLGLELIAVELVAKGFNVIFIDACMAAYNQFTPQDDGSIRYGLTDQQLRKLLSQFNPDIVGITSLFSNQANNVARVAALTKEAYPKAIITEGGSNATGDIERVLEDPNVDMVIRKEGVVSFPELCYSLESNQSSRNFTPVLGVSYKDSIGKPVDNPGRGLLPDLDLLAPRRLEIPLHPMYDTPEHTGGSRHQKEGRLAYIMSSQGCPLKCDFCHIHIMAGNIRYYSLARFEQEVVLLKAAGVTELVVEDDMFFADMQRAMAICDILKKHSMSWFEEGGLSMFKFMKPGHNLTYKQVLNKLAESGCYRFYLAIESANPQSLIESHKPHINTRVEPAEEIVRYATNSGIEVVGGFMVGFQNESLQDMERTVEYAIKLKQVGLAYAMIFIVTAIPGTMAYNKFQSLFPDLDLRTSHERAAFPVGGLTPEELTKLRFQWMQEVNGDCMMVAKETKNWGL